jgi:hypothetical protein
MVEYLNSLRTQQDSFNSTYIHEARHDFLLSLKRDAPWFPDESQLYVRTRLDALVDDIVTKEKRFRLLFLTGDAGDGKTALCAALARRLGFEGELQWETIIRGWRIIKDASEVEPDVLARRIEEQLQSTSEEGLIVAINEGRLRRLFSGLSPRAQALWTETVEPALEGWLNEEGAEELDRVMRREAILVVNFRHRFHVRTVTPSLLAKWTPASLWEQSPACGACGLRERCPILANIQDLRSPEVHGRVSDVLAYAHFSGQRLPFRRLQAVLATAATGGLGCADVQSPALATTTDLLPYRFYNALFLRNELRIPVAVRLEPMARSFTGADPAALVSPNLDRQIQALLGPSPTDPIWSDRPLPALEADAVRTLRLRLSPGARTRNARDLHHDVSSLTRHLRRWAMFVTESTPDLIWRRALDLVEGYANSGQPDSLRRAAVEALNRLHGVEELKTETITAHQIDAAGFRNPARQVLELNLGTEFSPNLERGPSLPDAVQAYLESAPTEIYLSARPFGQPIEPARLRLDVRIVEIFLSVASGYVSWQGLGPYRRALGRFHAKLAALAVAGGHKPAVTIRAQEKRYSVSVDLTQGDPKLRLEGQG